MLLTKDYYRTAFENRLRSDKLGDVDDYNLKLVKLRNGSYPLPYSFKGDYKEHLARKSVPPFRHGYPHGNCRGNCSLYGCHARP